jgi:hypothetical protein
MVYIEIIHLIITFSLAGYIYYLTKQQKRLTNFINTELDITKAGLDALMVNLNSHQIKTETKTRDIEKIINYNHNVINKKLDITIKDLPITIRKVIGYIEFARPLDKK